MKPAKHIIASLSLSAIFWFFTKSVYGAFLCFASGLASDADHILEYIIHFGWKGLNYERLYHVCENTEKKLPGMRKFKKLYLIFHSTEIVIFLWIFTAFTKNIYILAIAAGYSLHMMLDMIGNRAYPSSYFLIVRALKGFHTDRILGRKEWRNGDV